MSDDRSLERLRPPPVERLSGAELIIDTRALLNAVQQEPVTFPLHGHRQIAVLHRGPVRMVLYTFDRHGRIPDHAAEGVVAIQVLRGSLTVQTPDADHELSDGMVLVLDPGIRHSVMASKPTEMLLSVHLVEAGVPVPDIR